MERRWQPNIIRLDDGQSWRWQRVEIRERAAAGLRAHGAFVEPSQRVGRREPTAERASHPTVPTIEVAHRVIHPAPTLPATTSLPS